MKPVRVWGEVEEIPGEEIGWDDWCEWCSERDIHPLGSGRRGWWSELSTYIRGAKYILYISGIPVDILDDGELADLTRS